MMMVDDDDDDDDDDGDNMKCYTNLIFVHNVETIWMSL